MNVVAPSKRASVESQPRTKAVFAGSCVVEHVTHNPRIEGLDPRKGGCLHVRLSIKKVNGDLFYR